MKTETIEIPRFGGRIERVEGKRVGAFIVHPMLAPVGVSTEFWAVTHIDSGLCVAWRFGGESLATAAATALAELADWDHAVRVRYSGGQWPAGLGAAVRDVVTLFRGVWGDRVAHGDTIAESTAYARRRYRGDA